MNIFGNTTIRSLKNLPSGRGEVSPPTWPLRDGLRWCYGHLHQRCFREGGAGVPSIRMDHFSFTVNVDVSDPIHANVFPKRQRARGLLSDPSSAKHRRHPRTPELAAPPGGREDFKFSSGLFQAPRRMSKHEPSGLGRAPHRSVFGQNTIKSTPGTPHEYLWEHNHQVS